MLKDDTIQSSTLFEAKLKVKKKKINKSRF